MSFGILWEFENTMSQFMSIQYNLQFRFHMFFLVILLCISNITRAQNSEIPLYYTDLIYSIPDLTQTDQRADFPGGGSQFCCLVAISNSLMWLDSNGFQNLIENSEDPFESQVKLVKLLASNQYMDTNLIEGTGTTNLMHGIKKYVQDHGYEIMHLGYEGWRKHPQEMKTLFPIPRLSWIKHSILDGGSVWLNSHPTQNIK